MNRHFRLRKREDFERLRQRGRAHRHAWLTLSLVPNELEHNRYGMITGKVLGNAVRRNRVRRLLREAVRRQHECLKPGFDFLWIARPAIVDRPLSEIALVIEELARQAGVLKTEA